MSSTEAIVLSSDPAVAQCLGTRHENGSISFANFPKTGLCAEPSPGVQSRAVQTLFRNRTDVESEPDAPWIEDRLRTILITNAYIRPFVSLRGERCLIYNAKKRRQAGAHCKSSRDVL